MAWGRQTRDAKYDGLKHPSYHKTSFAMQPKIIGNAPLFHYCTAASCVVFDDASDRVCMTVSCWRVVAGPSSAHRGGNNRADLVITDTPHPSPFSAPD